MELGDLTRKLSTLRSTAEARVTDDANHGLRTFVQGYVMALDDVVNMIKRAKELERMRQRVEKLESEQAQTPEPDWSQVIELEEAASPFAANSNAKSDALTESSSKEAA